nr:MAG TPA: transcription termination factor Rho [Caudoviricetes sp.]
MKTITIKIVKKSVMGVVEGLSATIAQHNPEVDFLTVWASDAEEAKLDIYYREAITDLENFLARFSSSTTQQFDLQALADDFTITIKTLASWPSRLSGVLTNQIQNYLVHAILAGWLSDFPDMNHTDYASMGASDLEAIKEVLLKKDFSFAEAERTADDSVKDGSSAVDAVAREGDEVEKNSNSSTTSMRVEDDEGKQKNAQSAETRTSDSVGKNVASPDTAVRGEDETSKQAQSLATDGRGTDTEQKDRGAIGIDNRMKDDEGKTQNTLNVEARGADGTVKEGNMLDAEARNEDEVDKDERRGLKGSERNRDFASQHFHQDYVDWSGGRPPYELR